MWSEWGEKQRGTKATIRAVASQLYCTPLVVKPPAFNNNVRKKKVKWKFYFDDLRSVIYDRVAKRLKYRPKWCGHHLSYTNPVNEKKFIGNEEKKSGQLVAQFCVNKYGKWQFWFWFCKFRKKTAATAQAAQLWRPAALVTQTFNTIHLFLNGAKFWWNVTLFAIKQCFHCGSPLPPLPGGGRELAAAAKNVLRNEFYTAYCRSVSFTIDAIVSQRLYATWIILKFAYAASVDNSNVYLYDCLAIV